MLQFRRHCGGWKICVERARRETTMNSKKNIYNVQTRDNTAMLRWNESENRKSENLADFLSITFIFRAFQCNNRISCWAHKLSSYESRCDSTLLWAQHEEICSFEEFHVKSLAPSQHIYDFQLKFSWKLPPRICQTSDDYRHPWHVVRMQKLKWNDKVKSERWYTWWNQSFEPQLNIKKYI